MISGDIYGIEPWAQVHQIGTKNMPPNKRAYEYSNTAKTNKDVWTNGLTLGTPFSLIVSGSRPGNRFSEATGYWKKQTVLWSPNKEE